MCRMCRCSSRITIPLGLVSMMRSTRFRQPAKTLPFSPRARASRTTSKMSADSMTAMAFGSWPKTSFIHRIWSSITGGCTMAFSSCKRPWRKARSARRARFSRPSGPTTSLPKCSTIEEKTGWPGSMSVRPSASDSTTCAPSSRSIAATVDLPLPSPPVSPTRSTIYNPRPSNSRLKRAARTVFDINMAIVSKPTPPGTGVYAPAISKALG